MSRRNNEISDFKPKKTKKPHLLPNRDEQKEQKKLGFLKEGAAKIVLMRRTYLLFLQ